MVDDLAQRAATARTHVVRASAALDSARAERDALVVEMIAEGWSFARIGSALGVTRARAQQLVERARQV